MNIEESVEQLEGLIEAWELNEADLNQTDINALKMILKENQELKKQLEETFKNYKKEAYIVNKQTRQLTDEYENTKCQSDKVKSLLTQQKEFIKYLEDEISKQKNDIFANALTSEDIDLYIMKIKLQELEKILQKYRSIIGDKDEELSKNSR